MDIQKNNKGSVDWPCCLSVYYRRKSATFDDVMQCVMVGETGMQRTTD
jgi:hypothetical protein